MKIIDRIKSYNYYDAISRLVGCFFLVSIILLLKADGSYHHRDLMLNINTTVLISILIVIFVFFSLLYKLVSSNIIDSYLLIISALIYSVLCLYFSNNFYIAIGFSVLLIFIIIYLFKDDKLRINKINFTKRKTIILISCFVLLYVIFGIVISVYKCLTYNNSTYDIGIFGQMYSSMTKTFLPNTTCERDYLLSHFSVHFSPILYVLLPFYAIFPSIITLDVLQVLVIASGIIPLYMICKNHDFSNKKTLFISFVFCLFPAFTGGCLYDFHENMFLVPSLLWLILCFEKKTRLFFIPLLLTLFIKEDAFVYTTVISLYFLVDKSSYKKGSIGILTSIVYFVIVSKMMSSFGLGTMNDRFSNYMTDDSLISVFTTIFKNPGYLFNEVFIQNKFIFMLKMLLPLLFIPFMSKNLKQLILFIPLLLVNLMPAYIYQYDINFQYVFGSSVCLIYLLILNIDNVSEKQIMMPAVMSTCFLLFLGMMLGQIVYSKMYYDYKEYYSLVAEELEKLDRDKSVVASTCYLPHLIDFEELHDYDYPYAKTYEADYVVFDARFGITSQWINYRDTCLEKGYSEIVNIDGYLIILEK